MKKQLIEYTPIIKLTLQDDSLLYIPIKEGVQGAQAIKEFNIILNTEKFILIGKKSINVFQIKSAELDKGNLDILRLPKELQSRLRARIKQYEQAINNSPSEVTVSQWITKLQSNEGI